ncbi:hypothetical protein KIH87_15250 [Paraneptunicella aestuarii]|uniref:hypothetical protein n=1 Tax=Paraneptunicella aestuarii TaxID=2831148 RepID=UPI001E3A3D69|nr:hypothetical protein [Paraneptunicella aestuarii]UAA38034.1 hypothetical protein KIH87_15250 [Paraneptunicella aestuarii]
MKLKKYLLTLMLVAVSGVSGAIELQAESEAGFANSGCWLIFCTSVPSNPVPMGPDGGGDPPPDPN